MTPLARRGRRLGISFGVMLLGLSLWPAGARAFEAQMYAIEDFRSDCGGGDRSKWANMVDRWYDKMGDKGHIKDGSYIDGNMTIQRFCDPDWNGSCRDHWYADEADAVMIGTHGTDSGDHWAGLMRYRWNGHCYIDGGGSSSEMRIGDVDAEFIALSSCNSADDDNLGGIWRAMYDPADTPGNGRRAHQWDGFHGYMWIGSSFYDEYREFAKDAHSVSIADSWVDNLYETGINCFLGFIGDCATQCPVAYAIGRTEADCLTRLNHERYNNVYSDPSGHGWYCYKYIVGCDPKGESSFNP